MADLHHQLDSEAERFAASQHAAELSQQHVGQLTADNDDLCAQLKVCIRPSTKSFFDFNDIWYVGRGQ